MPWPCRVYESAEAARAEHGYLPVGAIYPATWLIDRAEGWLASSLSPRYRADWMASRPPYVVKLPDGTEFCIDSRATRDGQFVGDGWTVAGELPRVTLSPSINIVGSYHGWIADGVISDDCEGRRFPHARGVP